MTSLLARLFVRVYARTSELANGLVNAENRLKAFAQSAGTLGKIIANFSPQNIINELTNVVTKLGEAISSALSRVGKGLMGFGKLQIAVGAGLGGALLAAAGHFAHTGDALEEMSQRTGIATTTLSELGYAAGQTGAELTDLEAGFRRMQRTIAEAAGGSKTATEDLGALGIRIADIQHLSPDQQFERIADGLAGIHDPTLRAAAAMAVLGRGGTALLPMMENGSRGIREFRSQAVLLGLSVTPAQAKLAGQLADSFAGMKSAAFAAVFAAGEALAPVLLEALKVATDLTVRFRAWIVDNKATVQLVGKLAVGLLAAGAAATVVGAGFAIAGKVLAIFTSAVGMLGSAVATILPIVSIGLAIVSIFGVGPIMAFVGAIGSAIASAGILGGALSVIGTVAAAAFWPVTITLGVIAAGIAVATAAVVGLTGAVVAGSIAFWKLTDPIKNLLPVAKAAFDSLLDIGQALFKGDIQGAANLAIDGMKQIILRGTHAILSMMQSAMQRIPTLISSVLSGTGSAASAVADTIRRAFIEIWPAVKLSFQAFLSFAGDVLDQLPAIAGYAAGRLYRAMNDAVRDLGIWMIKTFVNIAGGILKTFVSFGPKLIKAMFTGNIGGLVKEITMAFAAIGGFVDGVQGASAAMPDFKPSAGTVAAWQAVSAEISNATGASVQGIAGPVSGGTAKTTPIPADKKAKDTKSAFDHTPLEKYKQALADLKAEKLTTAELAAGMAQLKKETLGIDATPIEAFEDRLVVLNAALADGTITIPEWKKELREAGEEIFSLSPTPLVAFHDRLKVLHAAMKTGGMSLAQWKAETAKAKQEILGIDPTPLQAFATREKELKEQLKAGVITKAEYTESLRKTKEEIFGLQLKPLDEFKQRLKVLDQALQSGAITQAEWQDQVKRAKTDILGLDVGPLQQFADRVKELREQQQAGAITGDQFATNFRKAQQDFLGLDTIPIETYKKRIEELRKTLAEGLITKDQFEKGAIDALPDKVKSIIDETRTPLEKYKKDLKELTEFKDAGLIDQKTFERKKLQLQTEVLPQNRLVTYSAQSLINSGRGATTSQDRMLRKIEEQTEEARLTRRATERLADGLTHR